MKESETYLREDRGKERNRDEEKEEAFIETYREGDCEIPWNLFHYASGDCLVHSLFLCTDGWIVLSV